MFGSSTHSLAHSRRLKHCGNRARQATSASSGRQRPRSCRSDGKAACGVKASSSATSRSRIWVVVKGVNRRAVRAPEVDLEEKT